MALRAGTRLGAYEITGGLGAGGMGEVYRATDTKLGRDVAIKTLPSAFAQDPDRLARFEREAKLLAALNHPHIAVIHGLDEHDGTHYLAMELVEGETVEQKLKGGPLPVQEALQLALQIAEALEAAHEKGVVHRDLKPANIMVTSDGQVKVLDFGLAKAFSGDPDEASPAHSPALSPAMTQQGLILGTAGYMSPEQASGQAADQRADVWAFGVVLFEMLSGLPPFGGESVPHILAAILQTEPNWSRLPKNLHPRLRQLLERCLEKKVRNRYHGIADARVDIEAVLSDPRGVTPVTPSVRPASRRALPLVAAAAAIVTAAIAGLAAWSFWPAAEPPPVNRFSYELPEDQPLRNTGRSVFALAPDGRRFVYNTTQGLYVRSMDALEAQLIPGSDENLASPFFAPDGQAIGYWTIVDKLKRTALSGGASTVIAAVPQLLFGASWGADGTILYGEPEGVFRVSADGGVPELVIPADDGEQLYGPELLPDADAVLFSSTRTGDWDRAQIVVQSMSTGKRTLLIDGGSDAHYVPAGYLVYARDDRLLAVAFDAGRLTVRGEPVSLVSGVMRAASNATGAANYGVSDDGTLVYVSGYAGGGSKFVWVDQAGDEQPLEVEQCLCYFPSLSPDGALLAFSVVSRGTGGDIWVWSLSQHTFTRVTFGPGVKQMPLWTPDGKRIVYRSPEGLFWLPAEGTAAVEPLVKGSGLTPFGWTKDGDLLFTDSAGGNVDIGELAITGDPRSRLLLAQKFNEDRPALSPDGRWLAYESDESGRYEIYVRPFPNVQQRKQQVSEGGGQEPRWSPDGGTLYFLGPESVMATQIRRDPAFSFQPAHAVLDRAEYLFQGAARQYDVAPDGRRLLLAKAAAPGARPRIVVVTNWLEELKRRVPTN